MADQKVTAADPAAQAAVTEPAAKAEPDVAAGSGPAKEEGAAAGAGTKTYDQTYVEKLLADQKAAQEAAVAEALKVAKMDEESKAAYEKEQAAKKLEEREAEIARRELKVDARGVLAEKEVPAEFLDMLLGTDLKATTKNVETFKAKFDAAVQAQVEKRLVGKTPQSGNGGEVSEEAAMAAEIDKYL